MWIEREISAELVALARSHPVIVLTGPRQVGKTSLLERLFSTYHYVSLASGLMATPHPEGTAGIRATWPPTWSATFETCRTSAVCGTSSACCALVPPAVLSR